MESFCGGPFGPVPPNSSKPDLTLCFQQLVFHAGLSFALVIIGLPCLILWLTRDSPPVSYAYGHLLSAVKSLLCVALAGLSAAMLSLAADTAPPVELMTSAVDMAAQVLCVALHWVSHPRIRHGSGLLLHYWLLRAIAASIFVRSLALRADLDVRFALTCASLGVMVLLFALECLPKVPASSVSGGGPAYQKIPASEAEADFAAPSDGSAPPPCPADVANIFSTYSFWWLNSLVALGRKKPMELQDIPPVPEWLQTEACALSFPPGPTQRQGSQSVKFMLSPIWSSVRPSVILTACLTLATSTIAFLQPQLLSAMMTYLEEQDTVPVERGYFIALAMFAVALVQSTLLQQLQHRMFSMGVRLRTGLVTAVFDKSFLLSNSVRQQFGAGEAVNHMVVDAQRLMDFASYTHTLWSTPLQVAIAYYFLYQEIGFALVAGLVIMVLVIPLDTLVSRHIKRVQKAHMGNKDQRMKLLDELVTSVKLVKLCSWEQAYKDRLQVARKKELETLTSIFQRGALQTVLWSGMPVLVTVFSLGAYVLFYDEPLTPIKAFVSLSLFSLLQAPLTNFPAAVAAGIDAYVALGRLAKYFSYEELQVDSVQRLPHDPTASAAIVVKEATFSLTSPAVSSTASTTSLRRESAAFRLRNIDFECAVGSLTAIIGPVGSGKSSLISSLLGEFVRERGSVSLRGRVAYVPQQAWIMNATFEENVLFGKPMNPQLYAAVLAACDLQKDIENLAAGDQTEIGERGINLSGGQKQRVSLARSAYSQSDVYLLDDPLSAVDPLVARHIFENLLGPHGLLHSSTRLLVTHRLESLNEVDLVLVMREGEIVEKGTYAALREAEGGIFATLMATYASTVGSEESPPPPSTVEGGGGEVSGSGSINKPPAQNAGEKGGQGSGKPGKKDKKGGALVQKEYKVTGSVGAGVYKAYAEAVSLRRVLLLLALLLLVQVAQVGSSVWLQVWSTSSNGVELVALYLGVYAALGLSQVFLSGLQSIVASVYCGLHAAAAIYERLFLRVIHSPMSFFNTTPLGRILNRFSKDVDSVDLNLPRSMSGFLRQLFVVLGIFAAISYSIPPFAPIILPVGACYFWMQQYFMPTKRDLKRLDSVLRSPTLAHFAETLQGQTTVRAFEQQARFMSRNRLLVSQQLSAFYYSIVTNRWQGVRLDFLGSLVVLTTGILVVALLGPSDSALGGIAITYALQLTLALNTLVRTSAETENHIVALERIREYDALAQEAPGIVEGNRPPPSWPSQGVIAFRQYSTRYREGLDLALEDVTFETRPREKIGVVGRTGAGKSTLLLCIPRLLEPASGTIVIDGVDITKIGLDDLRTKLAVIPQDPILLTGTLRENLDPFQQYSDDDLWRALTCAQLDAHVRSQKGGLSYAVTQQGGNLSVGQRQLLCLARALLHRAKVLLLDEATAAVDVETDERIQKIIRTEFVDSTVITIAHRLNTVMDSDRIMVVSNGRIVDFDSPDALQAKNLL